MRAIRMFEFNLRRKSVLLKPSLVEYIAGVEVNTNPVFVGAAAEALLQLGAKRALLARGRVINETGISYWSRAASTPSSVRRASIS
jgi:hypothetical protein